MGNPDDAREEALNCIDLGEKTGFILSPGYDLPMDTPPENIKAVIDLLHDNYKQDLRKG